MNAIKWYQRCMVIIIVVEYISAHNCTITKDAADCSKRGLTDVPADLPRQIKYLKLEDNLIVNISDGAFQNYALLVCLNLSSNSITKLHGGSFTNLENLRTLTLKQNKLNYSSSFDHAVFKPLRKLQTLDISDNNHNPQDQVLYPYFGDLQNVVNLTMDIVRNPSFVNCGFNKTKNLEKMEFRNCRLQHLKNNTFSGTIFDNKILTFSGCKLMSIVEANALLPFSKLSTLILSSCCLTLEQAFTLLHPFQGRTMETIEFSNVNEGYCNGSILKAFAVIVTRKMMFNLQNICVKNITLEGNGIVDFQPKSLLYSNYPECFNSIIIRNNHFCVTNGFKAPELAVLLSKLTNLTIFTFSESEMSIPIVQPRKTSGFKIFENVTIPFPPNLKNVTLSKSDAGLIPSQLHFREIASLEYVDLSYYRMVKFPNISFTGGAKLSFIDISGIPSSLYADRIGVQLFRFATTVVINNSRLSQTIRDRKNIFSLFPSVIRLNIANNLLWEIPKGFFRTNVNLTFLDLRRNLLGEIPVSVIELPQLKNLYMQNNVLQTINSTMRDFFEIQRKKLKSFKLGLAGNVFKCTCENKDFVRWIFHTKIDFGDKDALKCQLKNGTTTKISTVYREYNELFSDCDAVVWLRVGIIMLVAFVTLSIPISLVVNFRWKIALWIFRFFKRTIEKEINQFTYDVYLSCAEDGLEWTNDILIPKMEDWELKIFFEAEIQPGSFQLDEIAKGINKSRNIVFVVSKQFCDREYSEYEIRNAMYEKFCRTLQRIIVITRDIDDAKQFPIQLGNIVKDIFIINWTEDEIEHNFEKLKTLVDKRQVYEWTDSKEETYK